MQLQTLPAQQANLTWSPSPDTNVVGYAIYYGGASQTYTNTVVAGNTTNLTITGLTPGGTYYFVATAYDADGNESPFSNEATYSVPQLPTPTLDAITNLTLNENAPAQVVGLTGIASGYTNQNQTLTVTVTSSNPALVPPPTVNYASPAATGTLLLQPAANVTGTAIITVTVDNGTGTNNLFSQSFTVTVNSTPTLNAITNVTVNDNATATINLSGISSGTTNQSLALTVTASSSNPALIPTPSVNYTSPNTTGSLSFLPATNGVGTATITVTVANGINQTNQTFNVTVVNPNAPQITKPLTNTVALAGQNVSLSVTATGQGSLKYIWKLNGTKISGSGASLSVTNFSSKNAGVYSVMVSNTVGTATSAATFSVTTTPAASLTSGTTLSGGQFSFTVTGISGYSYTVQGSTDLANWTSLATNTSPFVFVDTNASQFGQRFYRAVTTQ